MQPQHPLKVSKGLENSDFSTLDLSVENVEKAYEAFKAEDWKHLTNPSTRNSVTV